MDILLLVAIITQYLHIFISFLGVSIIAFGALRPLASLTVALFKQTNFDAVLLKTRLDLGNSIVLGLEFILAADILQTIITPDYYSLGIISILAIIRTGLSYFLTKEITDLKKNQ